MLLTPRNCTFALFRSHMVVPQTRNCPNRATGVPVAGGLTDGDGEGGVGVMVGVGGGPAPSQDAPLTRQLAGVPLPLTMKPKEVAAPAARAPFHPALVKV
jgi:hypothetical protein